MADTFGTLLGARQYNGGSFYATPAVDVPAGAIFMPAYSTSPQFGIAPRPVPADALGSFETSGTFAFDKPASHTSTAGKPIYYKPTSAVEGAISGTSSSGAVLIGFEVVRPDVPTNKILVDLVRSAALVS